MMNTKYWNYRVLRKQGSFGLEYGIYEVHYTNGKPDSNEENESIAFGESASELFWKIEQYRNALRKPVLDYDTLQEIEPAHLTAT